MKEYLKQHLADMFTVSGLLLLSLAMMIGFLVCKKNSSLMASIYIENKLNQKIDLDKETDSREIRIQGTQSEMTIEIKHNSIAVVHSGCPSQTCVHMSPLNSNGTIVCTYNQVWIQVGESSFDAEV